MASVFNDNIVFLDRAKETTNTIGRGPLALAGPVQGFQALSGIGWGTGTYFTPYNYSYYTLVQGDQWEVGLGSYNNYTNDWVRNDVFDSSVTGAAAAVNKRIDLVAGGATVFLTLPASKLLSASSGDYVGIGVAQPQYELDVAGTSNLAQVRIDAEGADAPFEIKGDSNVAITWSDGTKQNTSPTGDISIVSGMATPGGVNHDIQFNSSGEISAASGLQFYASGEDGLNYPVLVFSGNPVSSIDHKNLDSTITIGTGINASSTSTIIGDGAGSLKSSPDAVFVGFNAQSPTDSTLTGPIGIGVNTRTSTRSVVIGGMASDTTINAGSHGVAIGYNALKNTSGTYNIGIGYNAGYPATSEANYATIIGAESYTRGDKSAALGAYVNTASVAANASQNTAIGYAASAGSNSIAIGHSTRSPSNSYMLASGSNTSDIGISGSFGSQLYVNGKLGINQASPNGMLEVVNNSSSQIASIVQGASSQTANLTEWQNSSESILAKIDKDGDATFKDITSTGNINISGIANVTGLITTATGIVLQRNTPAVTTDKLYNVGGVLYFNGSGVNGAGGGGTSYTAGSGLQLNGTTFDALTATTSASGIIQLQDSATDGTTNRAITPNAVYDISGVLAADVASTGTTNAAAITTNTANIASTGATNAANITTVSGLTVTNTSNIASTGATNAAAITTNTTNIASTGATNAANITTVSGLTVTNTSNIASTGATNAAAITTNTTNIASTGATNAANITTVSGLTVTNTSNIASTGATNAAAITTNTTNIASTGATNAANITTVSGLTVTNTSNIASTGATNAAAITTNTTNIASTGATNAANITTVSGLTVTNTSNIASTGATNAAAITTNTTNIASTGATNAANITTVSGLIPTYTAGSGLTLVGTQFNTADTGNFTKITFGQGASATTDNLRIGHQAGDSAPATSNGLIAIGGQAAKNIKENSDYGIVLGAYAGGTSSGNYNVMIGYGAGDQQEGGSNITLGYYSAFNSVGSNNLFLGYQAGIQVDGSNNIELVTYQTSSPLDNQSNKINVEYTIIGDTSAKKLAIGNVSASDISPDATLEIKPKEHTDIGLIVQGDTSHSANLTEWQNSSETVVASVAADGDIFTSGTVSATGGILIDESARILWSDDSVRIGTDAGDGAGGDYDVMIGYQAGKDSDGDHNISLGYQAGYSMSATSDYNLCLGRNAGRSADGDFNVFLGTHAGYDSDGERNIYIGYQAGFEADPGSNNIEILTSSVYGVKSTLDGLSNKINIENTIMGDTAANKIVIGTGTTAQTANYSPAATLEIKPKETTDTALIVHSSGLSNVLSVYGSNVSVSGRLLGPISAPVLEDTNATVNVALSSGNYHEVELAAAVTKVIFKEGAVGQRFMVRFAQPAGANYTIAWTNVDVDEGGTGGTVSWAAGGTAPTMTATNGKADTYGFIQRSATTFDGFVVGQNI